MGDGLTSEDIDIADVKDVFSLWDKDETGKINVEDLGNVMRALGLTPTEAEIAILTQEKDGKSKMDFEDVRNIISTKMVPNDPMAVLREAFQILDKNGKGSLEPKYFRQIMTELGDVLDDEEAEEIMRDMPTDNEGKINYEEFIFKVLNPDTK